MRSTAFSGENDVSSLHLSWSGETSGCGFRNERSDLSRLASCGEIITTTTCEILTAFVFVSQIPAKNLRQHETLRRSRDRCRLARAILSKIKQHLPLFLNNGLLLRLA